MISRFICVLALILGSFGCERGAAPAGPPGPKAGPGEAPASGTPQKIVIRVGHFPNVTHSQALIAHAFSRKGKGWFEERLGPGVEIQWFIYNAGPSVIEAIFAGSLDLSYIGPNPALNGYFRSKGEEIRVIRFAAQGGSALIVQGDGRIASPADFRGIKIATPQLGNTQDVACRSWLLKQGFKVTLTGGEATVIPTANPDQLTLFLNGDLDAVWTVEPWVSRLILEAKGKVFLEEPEAVTTILISSVKLLREKRDLARKFAEAHSELTAWMEKNPEEAQKLVIEELNEETRGKISPEMMKMAWSRLKFRSQISREAIDQAVADATKVGFLQEAMDLKRFFEDL